MRTIDRLAVLALAVLGGASWGQAAPPRDVGIYSCIDDHGNLITRDRYIAECRDREQRLLNPDGSLRKMVPPTLTPDELAQRQAAERARRDSEAGRADAKKYDLYLMRKYPNEGAHDKAREDALDTQRLAIQSAEARLRDLAAERKHLLDEAEFYRGRPMPQPLKQQLDGNEAAAEAQRNAIKNAQAEMERINRKFDVELERLRKLWKGAPPGSLGPPPQ
jgi:hypothetical protein